MMLPRRGMLPHVTVPFDYDADPQRYKLGMRVAAAHAEMSLYDRAAEMLQAFGVGVVLDVGCADGCCAARFRRRGRC